MRRRSSLKLRLIAAVTLTALLPWTTLSQQPVPQREHENQLTAAEEKDSYEIYSMLLKTELPPQWKITAWAITQETETFPNYGAQIFGSLDDCLRVRADRESIYRPLFNDYLAKNGRKIVLERKFDLPEYALLGPEDIKAIRQRQRPVVPSDPPEVVHLVFPYNATVIFHVSAVGFNHEGTRALVYVGHDCGSLCGGGRYHLLVKKDGLWRVDSEFRGASCMWKS